MNSHSRSRRIFLPLQLSLPHRVCGLDYTFTITIALGVPRLVSTPSSYDAWLGIAILQVSPNLRNYTHKVSQMRLNFTISPLCLPIPPRSQKNLLFVSYIIILQILKECQAHFFVRHSTMFSSLWKIHFRVK